MSAGEEGPSGSKKRQREDELSCTLPEDYVSAACGQHSDSIRSCLVLPAHGHLFLLMLLVVCIALTEYALFWRCGRRNNGSSCRASGSLSATDSLSRASPRCAVRPARAWMRATGANLHLCLANYILCVCNIESQNA